MADGDTPREVTDPMALIAAAIQGQAPAVAMATAQQTLAHAASLAALNAVQAQQQSFISHQAATDRAVAMLYGLIDD